MNAISVTDLHYRYTKEIDALRGISCDVPEGAIFGLIGPNGAGKSTLLQCCAGLRYAQSGAVSVRGRDARDVSPLACGVMGYVSADVALPTRWSLARIEAYIAPLHARWDQQLATHLHARFALDPTRRISSLSRGERMKASLLCALAARPALLVMDEPFTGMDVLVKDDLVRGLLSASIDEGTTIVIASHDLQELDAIIDHVGIISSGRIAVSGSMEYVRDRFRRVTIVAPSDVIGAAGRDDAWMAVEHAGRRLTFVADASRTSVLPQALALRFPGADRIDLSEPSLRELFTTLAGRAGEGSPLEQCA